MRLPELPTREASVCSSPSSKRRVPSALRAKVQELNPISAPPYCEYRIPCICVGPQPYTISAVAPFACHSATKAFVATTIRWQTPNAAPRPVQNRAAN